MAAYQESARILEYQSTGVLLLNAQQAVLHMNPAAENLLGVSLRQARGRRLGEVLPDPVRLTDLLERAVHAGQPYTHRELELQRADGMGEHRIVDCKITPVEPGNAASELIVELLDATRSQRIHRDDALLAQHSVSRRIVRQLAHEIKNPLGGLRGAAQLLERELDAPQLTEYTGVIIHEADRLASLVDELLGPGDPCKQPVNIHELLQHVRHLVEAEAPAGVQIGVDYDPSLPPLWLDRNQMIQAMLNLARNAVQAVGEDGTVGLRTRALTNVTIGQQINRVVASVEFCDDGPGVPENLRETIFYPLVTGRPGGTGLGLALAQELVHRHDGRVEFDSEPGSTTFRILLPLSEADDQRQA